jgi:2,3-bisphosphoglycerate-independent phosphoglycerate mutase
MISQIIAFCKINNFDLLVTADHGNCEEMWTAWNPKTAHTTNPVPFRYIKNGQVIKTKPAGWLSDIAPTVLTLMGLKIPSEMTGKSLA